MEQEEPVCQIILKLTERLSVKIKEVAFSKLEYHLNRSSFKIIIVNITVF
jgi:hypothetical protein